MMIVLSKRSYTAAVPRAWVMPCSLIIPLFRLSTLGFWLLFAFAASTAFGATAWYVDCKATAGANNGTSWVNAWTELQSADRNSAVAPGDTVEISGGIYTNNTGMYLASG